MMMRFHLFIESFAVKFSSLLTLSVFLSVISCGAEMPTGKKYTNSLGMDLVRIEPGTFVMGTGETPLPVDGMFDSSVREDYRKFHMNGDFDEHPSHRVRITKSYYMGVHEVTNSEYEVFDPGHSKLRGKLGFSKNDDEAAVFVSWNEAAAFCEWLSEKEGMPYRLPTEAEWEYACRAGTSTPYFMGSTLPVVFRKNAKRSWYPDPERSSMEEVTPLTVGVTLPNAWGLYDMHGNVEEWCNDWYGPYRAGEVNDPVGYANGDFRVSRGGSHSTELYFLRSANRMAALPDEKSWVIGFRVVLGEMPDSEPLPVPPPPHNMRDVSQNVPADLEVAPDPSKPYFKSPRPFVKIPPESNGPLYSHHNHCPSITECSNGDLLAIWYSTNQEPGRELTILASRLRYGEEEWEPASEFWNGPDRNDHASALWTGEDGTLYHFNGISSAATWGNLATIMRTSEDNGATWSPARLIIPEHGLRHMPIPSLFRTSWGSLLLTCDAVTTGNGGTAIWLSERNDTVWKDPGGTIAGIHAGVVELKDGRLMAFGRGDNIDGRMPKSISADRGKTWSFSASPFPPISGGQRLALIRLQEGPIFFASFAKEITFTDASGNERTGSGLFAALSFDEGKTWSVRRMITDDRPEREVWGGAWTRKFIMSPVKAEPRGYLDVIQAKNGVIHLISSAQHYRFNYKWLVTPPPSDR